MTSCRDSKYRRRREGWTDHWMEVSDVMDIAGLSLLPPEAVVFWSGAGISVDAPTCGPVGPKLMTAVLDAYFAPGTYEHLQKLYSDLGLEGASARPRLETVLDVAVSTYGIDVLADALAGLAAAPPNAHHAFFAQHLAAGGHHVTANFDTCIERSDERDAPAPLHFHGSLGAAELETGLSTLGARLSTIENGFPVSLQHELDRVLGSPSTQALVFVGYSGSDFFDAEPYLRTRGFSLMAGKLVVWHDFRSSAGPTLSGSAATAGYLPLAHAAGANVVQLTGPLTDLRSALTHAWRLPPPDACPAALAPAGRTLVPVDRGRAAATGLIYARMGLRNSTVTWLQTIARPTAREHELLADALWAQGRYRAAGMRWKLARTGQSPDAKARRTERRVAVRWIRGQLLLAQRQGWKAVTTYATPHAAVSPETKLELLETYLRVVTHMHRLPDVRWRIQDGRVRAATAWLDLARADLDGREGVQLRARVESARDNVAADGVRRDHARGFAESESLHGWLNYSHAELRARVESHRQTDPAAAIPADEYRLLRNRFGVLGAHGDVARVCLLPGAEQVLSPRQVMSDWKRVDITGWHRFRLLSGFTLRWLRNWSHARAARRIGGSHSHLD